MLAPDRPPRNQADWADWADWADQADRAERADQADQAERRSGGTWRMTMLQTARPHNAEPKRHAPETQAACGTGPLLAARVHLP
jgi:hypothetical protein